MATNDPSEDRGPLEPEHYYPQQRNRRMLTYGTAAGVLLVLTVVGLVTFRPGKSTVEANRKADLLMAALGEAGLPVPSNRRQVVTVLGEDGGPVCANPGGALKNAIRNDLGSNGAGGPGMRPVFIAEQTLRGEALVLEIYCPDELPAFLDYVDGLDVANVIRN